MYVYVYVSQKDDKGKITLHGNHFTSWNTKSAYVFTNCQAGRLDDSYVCKCTKNQSEHTTVTLGLIKGTKTDHP